MAAFTAPAVIRAAGPVALQGTLTVIGRGAGKPDDVAVAPDNTIYFGDMAVNQIVQLDENGLPQAVSPVISEPEGIVVMPDNTLIVAEQGTNRLYRVDPVVKTMKLFYAIGNRTKNPGVDGLSLDPVSGDIFIPDAPTGRVLHVSQEGKFLGVVSSGFKRPTSVAFAADGSLYVCDEYGNAIYHVVPRQKPQRIATIQLPDDVIVDGHETLIVNSLQGVIWEIDPNTGIKTELVKGLIEPHGIALDAQGALIITDAGTNQIYRLEFPTTDG